MLNRRVVYSKRIVYGASKSLRYYNRINSSRKGIYVFVGISSRPQVSSIQEPPPDTLRIMGLSDPPTVVGLFIIGCRAWTVTDYCEIVTLIQP